MFTIGKLVKSQAPLQLTHNCGSVGCFVGLEWHRTCSFSSSWQISLCFSRSLISSTSYNLGPSLHATPWPSAPALLQDTCIIKVAGLEARDTDTWSSLFSWVSALPCRFQAALALLSWLMALLTSSQHQVQVQQHYRDGWTPRITSHIRPKPYNTSVTSLIVVVTFWSNPNRYRFLLYYFQCATIQKYLTFQYVHLI